MTTAESVVASRAVAASNPDKGRAQQGPEPCGPIIVASIGVLGTAAVAWFSHTLSKRREAIARFLTAAKDFRAAFVEELAFLESGSELSIRVDEFLLRAYDAKHLNAFSTFEHFVPNADRAAFKAAWQLYHSGQQVDGEPVDVRAMGITHREALFIEYCGAGFKHPTLGPHQLAAHRIRELLAFARHL